MRQLIFPLMLATAIAAGCTTRPPQKVTGLPREEAPKGEARPGRGAAPRAAAKQLPDSPEGELAIAKGRRKVRREERGERLSPRPLLHGSAAAASYLNRSSAGGRRLPPPMRAGSPEAVRSVNRWRARQRRLGRGAGPAPSGGRTARPGRSRRP